MLLDELNRSNLFGLVTRAVHRNSAPFQVYQVTNS